MILYFYGKISAYPKYHVADDSGGMRSYSFVNHYSGQMDKIRHSRAHCQRLRGGRATMTGSAADSFTANDQNDLNRYVGFIERRKELKAELKQLQDEIDGLHEAHEEMLAMDPKDAHLHFDRNYPPALGFRWAETFTDWEPAAMAEYLEDKIRQMEGQHAEMENDLREIRERMTDLHSSLTSR